MMLFALMDQPLVLLAWILAIVVSLSFHEFSHALAATSLGDNTAKFSGRLTLNPLSHISWMGLLMLVLVGFGWGRPVPFNPYNLKAPKFGPAVVAIAGPFSNLVFAAVAIIIIAIAFPGVNPLFIMGGAGSLNLMAIFLSLVIYINLLLMIFNLIPIPPLDGSKILFAFLHGSRFQYIQEFLEEKGSSLLFGLILFSYAFNINIFGVIFSPVLNFVYNLFA